MFAYILKRLLLMIPTLFGVMLITFAVTQFVPGGPVEQLIHQLKGQGPGGEASSGATQIYRGDRGMDKERIEKLKALYGFDKPAPVRFWEMMKSFAVFDLGESYFHHKSVTQLVVSKLPVSISLGVWTFFIVYLTCIPLGIAKAVRDGSAFDVISSTVILVGYAIPGFVLGILLLVLFGGGSFWDVFPLRGLVSDNWAALPWHAKITDYLWHMVLPITASVVGSFAVMTMLTKNSFIEEIRKQYVLTARAKGLSENTVLYKHVFRNAMIPLVTGFPGGVHRRLLYRQPADRDHIFPRRTGAAVLRIGAETRLSGGAGHALSLYPAGAGRQAAVGFELRADRSAYPVRKRVAMKPLSPSAARLAALQIQPARLLEPVDFRRAVRAQPVRRGAVQRQAAGGSLPGGVLLPDHENLSGNPVRRGFRNRGRLQRSLYRG